MKLDDLKLRTKALIPVTMLVLTVIAMAAFGGFQLSQISQTANDLLLRKEIAQTDLLRSNRVIGEIKLTIFQGFSYDDANPLYVAALKSFDPNVKKVEDLLDQVAGLLPDNREDVLKFKSRFHNMASRAKILLDLVGPLPGISNGSRLTPKDLDSLADVAKDLAVVDADSKALVEDITAFYKQLMESNASAAAELQARGSTSLWALAITAALSTLAAGALALWILSSKIASPIARLAQDMNALANGDLSREIEGQTRRDEIGAMANAVQVFKTNAVERLRLEGESASQRAAAEALRKDAAARAAEAASEREAAARRRLDEEQALASEREATAAAQAQAIREIDAAVTKLAAKDLTYRISQALPAAYEPLRASFNAALDQLAEAFRNVSQSVDSVQTGTREIAIAANDLSRRTEQQASSLEESAAALNEITSTVQKAAKGAKEASEVVAAARADAREGGDVMRETLAAMEKIDASSRQISQILTVIDEIAFQTNLLALNAGVEAARAGDAGRGFAVVAQEVRALAQRAAEAAREIKTHIAHSSADVGEGVKLVAKSEKALIQIVSKVSTIESLVAGIATGTNQQASGLQEVNIAIGHMDQMTQQNASMAEQATAASRSLMQESEGLGRMIASFNLHAGDEDALRRELRQTVPHAFAKPAAPASPPARRPQKAAVNARAAAPADDEDWKDF